MDAERNKETIRRATEAWNARDRSAFLECHAAKGVSHPTSGEAWTWSHDELWAANETWFTSSPDVRLDTQSLISEGDLVSVRWRFTGTHVKSGGVFPATGRSFDIPLWGLYRVQDGRIHEVWLLADTLGRLVQLGIIEDPVAAAKRAAATA
jgi:predicted ester cyclase